MPDWLREFAWQYALWTFLDWVRTPEGKVMAFGLAAGVVSGLVRTAASVRGWRPRTRHMLDGALLASGFVVLGVLTWMWLAPPDTGPRAPGAPAAINYDVFTPGSPFPRGFGLVQRGTHLAAAKAAYPEGNLGRSAYGLGSYDVSISNGGPFSMVLYYFEDNPGDPDPVIFSADFRLVDGSAVVKVKAAALAAWGSDGFSEAPSGQHSSWADIGGYSVIIDREQFRLRWPKSRG